MLRDKSILENFDLVEELDDKSAALYSGGEVSGTWGLKLMGGKPVLSKREITASFQDGQVGGQSFCNSYSASYETTEEVGGVGKLKVGLIMTTAMGCLGPSGKLESEYYNALQDANSYTATSNSLILSGGPKTLLYERS